MKRLPIVLMLSFVFPSYYQVGDTVNLDHQNIPLYICSGEEIDSTIYLADNIGKISVLGIDATW